MWKLPVLSFVGVRAATQMYLNVPLADVNSFRRSRPTLRQISVPTTCVVPVASDGAGCFRCCSGSGPLSVSCAARRFLRSSVVTAGGRGEAPARARCASPDQSAESAGSVGRVGSRRGARACRNRLICRVQPKFDAVAAGK